jgi:hypothetical protein
MNRWFPLAESVGMRELEVGIRIRLKEGLSFFGIEEVNDLIRRGAKVVEIQPSGVIMDKLGEGNGHVRLTLTGCNIKLVLDEPSAS